MARLSQHLAAQMRAVGERIDEPFVLADGDGKVVWVNEPFITLCGHPLEQLVGNKPGHVLQGPASDADAVAALRRAVDEGQSARVTLINYHADGHPYTVAIDLTPLVTARGYVCGFVAVEREVPDAANSTICAACKKVRVAADRWTPIETYLLRHGMVFSHGLCLECADRYSPPS